MILPMVNSNRPLRRILIAFDNFGPYHIARLELLANHCDLLGLQLNASSSEYSWQSPSLLKFQHTTLTDTESKQRQIVRVASGFKPEVIFVPGWGSPLARFLLDWAGRSGIPCIVMSDTQHRDAPRTWFKELIKALIIRHASGFFVAGQPHADYLESLGINRSLVRDGYDVVDNDHFSVGAALARADALRYRRTFSLPASYLLVTARLVEKKNLHRLLAAFALAREQVKSRSGDSSFWHLVIAGDGAQLPALQQYAQGSDLADFVHFVGFRQYADMPALYGLAEGFILPSTTEQWGLAVNEAMAAGLPILLSHQCGSMQDLLTEGLNGYSFDPFRVDEICERILALYRHTKAERVAMGLASLERIQEWSLNKFTSSALELAELACSAPARRPSLLRTALSSLFSKSRQS